MMRTRWNLGTQDDVAQIYLKAEMDLAPNLASLNPRLVWPHLVVDLEIRTWGIDKLLIGLKKIFLWTLAEENILILLEILMQ